MEAATSQVEELCFGAVSFKCSFSCSLSGVTPCSREADYGRWCGQTGHPGRLVALWGHQSLQLRAQTLM